MEAIKRQAKVNEHGEILLSKLRLRRGTNVEVIILVRNGHGDASDLIKAAETSLGFWDNAVDDEVWNDA